MSDIDVQALFQEECASRLTALGDLVLRLENEGNTGDVVSSMFREAHTIKGAAAVVGLEDIAREAHVLEELLDRIRAGQWEVTSDVIDTILGSVDRLTAMAGANGAAPDPAPGAETPPPTATAPVPSDGPAPLKAPSLSQLLGGGGGASADAGASGGAPGLASKLFPALTKDVSSPVAARESRIGAEARQHTARVPVERLDDLVRVADEAAAAHLRLARTVTDKLGDDIDVSTDIRALTRLLAELHDKTLRARMVPVGTLAGQLRRAVRDVARATGKEVEFEFRGEDTEVDRSVHERLGDALIHLVRNGVDHGIEPPDERVAAGKSPQGSLVIHAMQLGSRVVITVTDDGRGVDVAAVKNLVRERLHVDPTGLSDEEVHELLFAPGLSTATNVTDVSGRGVGLDAVRDTLEMVRGTIEASSTPGKGMQFHLSVPITVALLRALVVHAGDGHFALPMHSVATVLSSETPVTVVEGHPTVRLGTQLVPLIHIGEVLGSSAPTQGPIVVIAGLRRTHAFRVDELDGLREVMVKALPPLVPPDDIVVGGGIEPDGSILLVVDPDGLVEAATHLRPGFVPVDADSIVVEHTESESIVHRARVLVVDDALTVRELQRSILQRAGFEVITANDGVDGLETLGRETVDLVLTDVEMPRMDGLSLTRAIRAEARWANLPVVVLTTRSSDADRQAGMDAGADAYIVKSAFTEAALISVVDNLLGGRR